MARSSISSPMPSLSTVCSWRYQAKPSTPTCVMFPPKQPLRSRSAVLAPARAAPSAARRPPGPLPTTRTSVSRMTSTDRAASLIALGPDVPGVAHDPLALAVRRRRRPATARRRHARRCPGARPGGVGRGRLGPDQLAAGSSTCTRQTEPRKLTATTRAVAAASGVNRTDSGRTRATTGPEAGRALEQRQPRARGPRRSRRRPSPRILLVRPDELGDEGGRGPLVELGRRARSAPAGRPT